MSMNSEPTPAEAFFLEGNRLLAASECRAAEACFREALALAPDFAEAHANLGMLLDQEGMAAEAERQYRLALALNPRLGHTHSNLGVLLANQKRFEEAESAYLSAIELEPDSPAAWSNLGVLQACRKQEREAEESYRTALRLDPDYHRASFNLSYLLLRQGRFDEGWSLLESRNRRWFARLEEHLPCPRWRGEDLQGRSLLIGLEAGHGDMIQFCRYAPLLKDRGAARITLVCHVALKDLLKTLDGVDTVISFDEILPDDVWDFWTPAMSIPCYCRTRLDSIPARIPYLHADPGLAEQWAAMLEREWAGPEMRIGLAWKGNPHFENDGDRSLPHLKTLEPLGAVAGVRFFSLQKGAGEEEAAQPPADLPVVNLMRHIAGFADTAALVANLDLVITVDTAVAHLAGALGTECWVLLPEYRTDWRWLTGRTDSPWYPGVMRLFRQPRVGDWETVVAEVGEALRLFAARPRSPRGTR